MNQLLLNEIISSVTPIKTATILVIKKLFTLFANVLSATALQTHSKKKTFLQPHSCHNSNIADFAKGPHPPVSRGQGGCSQPPLQTAERGSITIDSYATDSTVGKIWILRAK